jgi:beta-glucosidase
MYGTSVAAPIITAMYALAGTPAGNTYPASYLYQSPSGLTHVTSGNDSLLPYTCERTRGYLCSAAASLTSPYNGYNGPAGLGTPNGNLNPFKNTATGNVVSVTNPGAQDLQTGRSFSLQVNAIDSASGQTLSYSASGLPSGLSLSSSGLISGSVAAAGTSTVKVTATDLTGASTSVSFQITTVGSMTASYHAGAGAVKLSSNGKCMDDNGDSSANGTKIQIWQCYSGDKGQTWTYQPDTYPGDPTNAGTYAGTVRINGKCLDIAGASKANGAKVDLSSCTGQPNQEWQITGSYGELYNPVSNKCLDDPGWSNSNGTQLDIWTCSGGANQNWALPASPIDSAISDRCLNDSGDSSANGTQILSYGCDGSAPEKWTVEPDGTIRINGRCLEEPANSVINGTYAQLWGCNGNLNQQWIIGAYGQIESVNAEKCLAIPGNSTANGARVALEDCYGEPGELWAVS